MHTITIDCGASFIKGGLFADGVLRRRISYAAPQVDRTRSIFSIRQIPNLVEMVRNMVLELADREKEVVLCMANEMHGFLLAYEDGQPYTDYISWQTELGNNGNRGGNRFYRLTAEDSAIKEAVLHSGMPLRSGLPSSNLHCLSMTGKLPAGSKLHFYTLGTYILKSLACGCEPSEHETNAAATGLYDLLAGDWNRDFIEKIGGANIVMPDIGHKGICFRLNGIEVHALPAIGDQQAALLGAGFGRIGDLSFNLGTGAQVSGLADTIDFSENYQTRPYFGGKYLKTIPHIPAGRAFNVYFRFVKSILEQYDIEMFDDAIWAGMFAAAAKCHDASGLHIDLSFFENAVKKDTCVGSITNIGEYSLSLGSLSRAVMEQMADNFLLMADRLVSDLSAVKRLVFSGGVARRIDFVRERVAARYPGVPASIARDETMWGLYRYSKTGTDSSASMTCADPSVG